MGVNPKPAKKKLYQYSLCWVLRKEDRRTKSDERNHELAARHRQHTLTERAGGGSPKRGHEWNGPGRAAGQETRVGPAGTTTNSTAALQFLCVKASWAAGQLGWCTWKTLFRPFNVRDGRIFG